MRAIGKRRTFGVLRKPDILACYRQRTMAAGRWPESANCSLAAVRQPNDRTETILPDAEIDHRRALGPILPVAAAPSTGLAVRRRSTLCGNPPALAVAAVIKSLSNTANLIAVHR